MKITHQLITIFCEIDDFCKELNNYMKHYMLPNPMSNKRGPSCMLDISEIMTILIMFQMVRFRDFKTFYCSFVQVYWCDYFPHLPSYNRFVELIKHAVFPMTLFTQLKSGKRTGIYYIDSSCLPVCHLKRQNRHKTFADLAGFGRTSIGWFFGLKLHIVINDRGQLIAFKITRGNYNDSKAAGSLFKLLQGLAFGDKGYICKKLFDELAANGLKLITRLRKNMKGKIDINSYEKQLLNQRNLVETVIGNIKHHYQVWHTRHRSVINAITHLVSALAAYAIEPLKVSAIKLLMQTSN
jgi:hypothetical protein